MSQPSASPRDNNKNRPRGIKPANIMVSRRSDKSLRPILTDFGLARDVNAGQGLTDSGAVLGTDQDISDFPSEHVVKKQALQLREMARQQAKRGRWRRRVGNTARWQYSKFGYADNLAVSDYKPTHCDSDLSWKLLGDSEAGNAR